MASQSLADTILSIASKGIEITISSGSRYDILVVEVSDATIRRNVVSRHSLKSIRQCNNPDNVLAGIIVDAYHEIYPPITVNKIV